MIAEQLPRLFPGLESTLYNEMEKAGQLRQIPAGETVLRKGQFIRSVILLLEGTIKLYQEDEDGGEFFMYYIQPGEACAVSMVCTYRQETSQVLATAVTDVTVLLIPLSYMDKWMTEYKSWQFFVIQSYRLRDLVKKTGAKIVYGPMAEPAFDFYPAWGPGRTFAGQSKDPGDPYPRPYHGKHLLPGVGRERKGNSSFQRRYAVHRRRWPSRSGSEGKCFAYAGNTGGSSLRFAARENTTAFR